MRSRTKITTDPDEIRRWAAERGGHPAAVKRTRGNPGEPGILRIDFPGYSGAQSLEQISWEEFFQTFDEQNLAFLCQDTTARGLRSNFNKLIKRPSEKSQKAVKGHTSANRGARPHATGGAASKTKGARKKARRSKPAR
jgi:hypothetical protein